MDVKPNTEKKHSLRFPFLVEIIDGKTTTCWTDSDVNHHGSLTKFHHKICIVEIIVV